MSLREGTDGLPTVPARPPSLAAGRGIASDAGNTINHFNSNNNGGWGTTTQEGTATLVITPNGGSSTTYTGHVQEWDAGEFNKQNAVMHATLNFDGTNVADGTVFHLHANFDVTTNPAGATTASHFNVTCS